METPSIFRPELLRAETGFSGSGTPGAEYGSEASRTVWRVALDFLLFPGKAGALEGEAWWRDLGGLVELLGG